MLYEVITDELTETLKAVRELDIKAANKAEEIARIEKEMAAIDLKILDTKQAVLRIFKKYEPDATGERYRVLYETGDVSAQLRRKAKEELHSAAQKAKDIELQIRQALGQQRNNFV